jgi:hypothetical protein
MCMSSSERGLLSKRKFTSTTYLWKTEESILRLQINGEILIKLNK